MRDEWLKAIRERIAGEKDEDPTDWWISGFNAGIRAALRAFDDEVKELLAAEQVEIRKRAGKKS